MERHKKIKRQRLINHIDKNYIDASALFTPTLKRGQRRVMVYVEGYDDIAFWRNVLCDFESDKLTFEINVPSRNDLAKGKRVLLSMAQNCSSSLLLCMDSDFDYIFQGATEQSRSVLSSPYIIHTYAYSIENHLCYAPSLKSVCVKATKNDHNLFYFEEFMADFSSAIYPLFLWYSYSALSEKDHIFILADFRNAIRIGFIDLRNNGHETIEWLKRSVAKRLNHLETAHGEKIEGVKEFGRRLKNVGVERNNCYLFMQGHTLFDNVTTLLVGVCEALKREMLDHIKGSSRTGVSLENELSNYKNSLRPPEQVLHDNDNYKNSPLYKKIISDLEKAIEK